MFSAKAISRHDAFYQLTMFNAKAISRFDAFYHLTWWIPLVKEVESDLALTKKHQSCAYNPCSVKISENMEQKQAHAEYAQKLRAKYSDRPIF